MRRMVKEELLKFDGTPLFPERRATTVKYELSQREAALYEDGHRLRPRRDEPGRAISTGKRKGTVGFALTILQRRLASSPEAIYRSLRRRHERLQARAARADRPAVGRSPEDADMRRGARSTSSMTTT